MEEVKTKKEKKDFIFAVGRRREAVARVRLYANPKAVTWNELPLKKGDMLVNLKPIDQYFHGEVSKAKYTQPFKLTNTEGKCIVTVRVEGGGKSGQLDAVLQGIAQAMCELEPAHRAILKRNGYLTRDARVRQRRKVGTGGKARRRKQSPKR